VGDLKPWPTFEGGFGTNKIKKGTNKKEKQAKCKGMSLTL
jgi:hypothetical protein